MKRPRLPRVDDATGDELSRDEAISHVAQSMLRRWAFLLAITLVTALAWTYAAIRVGISLHSGAGAILTWWNMCASYLALFIESVVGIGVFHMAQRDAKVLREIRRQGRVLNDLAELMFEFMLRNER